MAEQWTVTMPKLGETVTEGTVGSWLKNVGDDVAFDDPLFEVSTDKVDSEIPSPYDGVIVEILVQAGETVPVGTPLVKIGEPGSTPGAGGGPASSDPAAPATGGSEAMPATAAPGAGVPGSPAASGGEVHDITMPKLGETVTEGTVGSWLKNVGDAVAFDDPLFEVSTDKVDSEIPSPHDGVILEILVDAGETVPVGTALVRIGAPGSVAGPSGASRLPSAAHGVAAAGGPALGDPASPSMGGSEGMAGEDPSYGTPTGVVHDITMPKLGETVTEGTIGNWLKQSGDTVAFDDPLFEVSTDKVDSEIPSPHDGVILEILVEAGETVPVGTVLARIGEPGAAASSAPSAAPATG